MGLMYHEVRELLLAKRAGARFRSVVTIGRQTLYLHSAEVRRLDAEFGLSATAKDASGPHGISADAFLRSTLEIGELASVDASGYEGATIVRDLNEPTPPELDQRFDALIDGGSLEHLFNVPAALASYLRMVRPDGRLFLSTPANNLCGHGFYQFSPELMFRAFGPESGSTVCRLLVWEARYPGVELVPAGPAFEVRDPAAAGRRVDLVSRKPAIMLVHALKTRHLAAPFAAAPQQSDYAQRWQQDRPHGRAAADAPLPRPIRAHLRGRLQRLRASTRNRRNYRKAR